MKDSISQLRKINQQGVLDTGHVAEISQHADFLLFLGGEMRAFKWVDLREEIGGWLQAFWLHKVLGLGTASGFSSNKLFDICTVVLMQLGEKWFS